jgi:hypothetical protein
MGLFLLSPTMLLSGDWYDKSNKENWAMPKAFALAFSLTSPNISIPSILLSILQSGKLESVVSHQQLGLGDLGDLDGRHIKCVQDMG